MVNNFSLSLLSNILGVVRGERDGEGREEVEATAAAPLARGSVAAQGGGTGRSGTPRRRVTCKRVRMERAFGARGLGCTQARSPRTAHGIRREDARRAFPGAQSRRDGKRICHRAVDAGARGTTHRTALRVEVQRQPGLAHSLGHGLELPAAQWTGTRAQRTGNRPMETQALAGAKKNARAQRRVIVFVDE